MMADKIKILIVDDSENECKTLKSILDAKGYAVFTAQNSEDAISQAKKEKPALMLLDLVIKGSDDGVTIFRKIRVFIPDIKAIMITGHGPEEEQNLIANAWKEGMIDEYLRKPISPDELLLAIRKHTS